HLHEALPQDGDPTLPQQRLISAKPAGLVPRDREAESRFERRILVGDVVTPVAIALLDAAGRHRVISRMLEAERDTGLEKALIDVRDAFARYVEFPAEFADVGDAARAHMRIADLDLARPAERMRGIRQIRSRQLFEQLPATWAHETEHRDAGRDVRDRAPRTRLRGDRLSQPSEVARLANRGSDDQILEFGRARNRQIRLDTAGVIEPLRVDDAADGHIEVRGRHAAKNAAGVRALYEEFCEARLIEQCDRALGRKTLIAARFEPVLPAIGIFILGLRTGRTVPVRPLPSRGLAHAGSGCDEPVVQHRAPRTACAAVLVIRPMHRIEKSQRLDGPVMQVAT